MAWLVDTNVLSELRKGDRTDPGVRAWLDAAAETDLHTSVLVVGEIRRGIESIRHRDHIAAEACDHWLRRTTEMFSDRILGIDIRVADRWGRLIVPNPIAAVDGLLAATALEHDLVLVTRNVKDVAATGVGVLDPFRSNG